MATSTARLTSVENVVTLATFDREFDIDTLADDVECIEPPTEDFTAAIYRPPENGAALIFRGGNVTITGADSIATAEETFDQLLAEFDRLNLEYTTPDTEIKNLVGSARITDHVNLLAVSVAMGLEHVEYEPEQFPGLIYRIDKFDSVVLLFPNGKLVVTGVVERELLDQSVRHLKQELQEFDIL